MEKTKLKENQYTIGAHFSAFLENRLNPLHSNYFFESARACLYALLKALNCKKIFLPYYICSAVTDAVKAADCKIEFYSINKNFEINDKITLRNNDLILFVNYFGLCEKNIQNQLLMFDKNKVIVDCSQAYFQPAFDCLATIYSPRKFIPVPDGGTINTDILLTAEECDNYSSIKRYNHLLNRVVNEPENSREEYLNSEQQLKQISTRQMSSFTKKIIETIDLQFIKRKRIENWMTLSKLQPRNKLQFQLGNQTPLCYPMMMDNAESIRKKLIKNRVFTPIYWSDSQYSNEFEWNMINKTLYLPLDHRYSEEHMNYIIDLIN